MSQLLLVAQAAPVVAAGPETRSLLAELASGVGAWTIPLCIGAILLHGAVKKVRVYEVFVEGAKEGFEIGVRIIPFLVAILVVVGLFRGSGAMDGLAALLAPVLDPLGVPVDILPMAVIRPLSGGAAQGYLADVLNSPAGPDSLAGRMVSVMSGSTETTFYVLAVYFGSVGVRRARHALPAALLADAAGLIAAIVFTLLFF
ncbi:MAG: nucleoside recognition domain-containing protein [Deltaproteobacteria bacterium]|nr:nucleoside recognition domain-containing protein [Deltaproteobacteria bacterium]